MLNGHNVRSWLAATDLLNLFSLLHLFPISVLTFNVALRKAFHWLVGSFFSIKKRRRRENGLLKTLKYNTVTHTQTYIHTIATNSKGGLLSAGSSESLRYYLYLTKIIFYVYINVNFFVCLFVHILNMLVIILTPSLTN